MNAGHRMVWRVALIGLASAVLAASCAEGSDLGNPSVTSGEASSSSASTGGGSGIPPGQVGGACDENEDCTEGSCTQVGSHKVCTLPCPPDCPSGTYCAIIEGDPICVPDLNQQCLPCQGSIDCKSPSDECLKAPLGDRFCAIDCSTMGSCPNGFTCVARADYIAGTAGSSSASSSSASTGAGGAGGNGGAGGAGGNGGADVKPPAVPYKFCVPNSGLSCPCNSKRDKVEHDCSVKNEVGTCSGRETCDGELGKWLGCTAETPKAEACNGKDDNCDAAVDEGEPNALCTAAGPVPPNATWACAEGQCELGACNPGWASYPPGKAAEGCACPVENGEPNDSCATAVNAGAVSDTGGALQLTGTLSGDTDVDVWVFDSQDVAEVNTNSYHVSIDLTGPSPNEEFVMDVIRGDACVDAPGGPATGITSYDWCVDGSYAGPGGQEGEAPCSATGAVHCNNNSAKYFVRVRRKPGATGTCAQYIIAVTAKGGDACDFTKKCL